MPTITLSADDLSIAFHLAADRLVESLRSNRTDAVWVKNHALEEYQPHFFGAAGELAVAKLLGLYPRFLVRQFSGQEPDLLLPSGTALEVRHRSKSYYELKVTKKDKPDRAYILVRGFPPSLDVVGWAWGYEAQMPDYLMDPGNRGVPAYFVPDNKLRDVKELMQ